MTTKVCICCKKELINSIDNFYLKDKKTGRLSNICKKCAYQNHKKYYSKNKNNIEQYKKEWRQENKSKLSEKRKLSYKNNSDSIKEKSKKHRLKNIDRYHEMWNKANKKYKLKNKEIVSKKHKEWTIKTNYYLFKNQRRRLKNDLITKNLTNEEWKYILNEFNNECAYCGNKNNKLTQEHFIPLSKLGEYSIHNIIPACHSCNSSKRDRDFEEWYPKQTFYTDKRYDFIKNHFYKMASQNNGWGRKRLEIQTISIEIR